MDIETEYIPVFDSYPKPAAQSQWVSDYESMIVHTQGKFPDSLINKRRPNESEEIKQYRVDNFKPMTRASFVQAKTNLMRTLSHSSVEIVYPEKIKEYLMETRFRKTNFLSYFHKVVIDKMIDAANARLVWWPVANVGDVSKQMEIQPIIVMPKDILHADENVFTFLSKEKSMVEVGGELVPAGDVYFIISETELWKRYQIGKPEENKWESTLYGLNPMGFVYALTLGGDEVSCENQDDQYAIFPDEYPEETEYYTSYFSVAVPPADECLGRFSDNQGVSVKCSSPLMEVERIKCFAGCRSGIIDVYDRHDNSKITGTARCGSCNGSGYVPITGSPYGVITRPARERMVGDVDATDIPTVRFIHPDVSILEYSDKTWRDFSKDTDDALNLLFVDQAQSGVAKDIDREDKLATLDKIALRVYKYLITNSIQIIYKFRYPSEDIPQVVINLPASFIIKDEGEIIADITALRGQNAPDFFLIELNRELLMKRFGADQYRMKIFNTLVAIDPLFIKSSGEKNMLVSATVITNEQATRSFWATSVVENFATEIGPDFAAMPLKDVIAAVEPILQAKVDETMDIVGSLDTDGGSNF